MRRYIYLLLFVTLAGFSWLGGKGWWDARQDAPNLATRADALIADGKGWQLLGPERKKWFLTVEDPFFETHQGVDFTTPGAGITTVSQSLAKRVAFDEFKPGIAKLRQTTYAMSLERVLSKEQIFALWADTAEMGPGANGWITGFEKASVEVFGAPPSKVSDEEFLTLVAVLIAPARFALNPEHPETAERLDRVKRLISGDCAPHDHSDVWLDGCAQAS